MLCQGIFFRFYNFYDIIEGFHIFFSGTGTKETVDGKGYGSEFYEVKSENTNIEGCYKQTDFHSVVKRAPGLRYSIYKKTDGGGQNGSSFILRVNILKDGAPWMFTDEEGNIKYE